MNSDQYFAALILFTPEARAAAALVRGPSTGLIFKQAAKEIRFFSIDAPFKHTRRFPATGPAHVAIQRVIRSRDEDLYHTPEEVARLQRGKINKKCKLASLEKFAARIAERAQGAGL